MDYIPLIITALVSIITSGFISRILTIKQENRKIEAEVEKIKTEAGVAEAKIFIDLTDVQEKIRKSLLEEINRKDSDCDDRIDKLKNEYEEKIKRIQDIHEEERVIFESKIDNLLARVAQLEYERLKT